MQALDRLTQGMSEFTKVEPGGGHGRLPPGQTRHLGSALAICMSLRASRGERMYVHTAHGGDDDTCVRVWVGRKNTVHKQKLEWICMYVRNASNGYHAPGHLFVAF